MLARYRRRDFSGAEEAIVRCRAADNGFNLDFLFDLYAERVRAFMKDPPPPDWNGAIALETK
jgi:adenylate cyclase